MQSVELLVGRSAARLVPEQLVAEERVAGTQRVEVESVATQLGQPGDNYLVEWMPQREEAVEVAVLLLGVVKEEQVVPVVRVPGPGWVWVGLRKESLGMELLVVKLGGAQVYRLQESMGLLRRSKSMSVACPDPMNMSFSRAT
jgi:hypothetical protein